MQSSFVKISDDVRSVLNGRTQDIENIVALLETTARLATSKPVEDVIKGITFTLGDPSEIQVLVDIFKESRSLMFGRKFTNVSCLRKLVSNASGKSGIYFRLDMIE